MNGQFIQPDFKLAVRGLTRDEFLLKRLAEEQNVSVSKYIENVTAKVNNSLINNAGKPALLITRGWEEGTWSSDPRARKDWVLGERKEFGVIGHNARVGEDEEFPKLIDGVDDAFYIASGDETINSSEDSCFRGQQNIQPGASPRVYFALANQPPMRPDGIEAFVSTDSRLDLFIGDEAVSRAQKVMTGFQYMHLALNFAGQLNLPISDEVTAKHLEERQYFVRELFRIHNSREEIGIKRSNMESLVEKGISRGYGLDVEPITLDRSTDSGLVLLQTPKKIVLCEVLDAFKSEYDLN